MSNVRKLLLVIFLVLILAVILLTWGSVGSSILVLVLIIAVGYLLLRWFLDTHDPDDYRMED